VGEVNDLVVNGQLLSVVVDDQDTDGARASTESLLETAPEMTLVDDLEAILDLAGLRHGDEFAVVTDVDETVLLEDGADHGVEDDVRGGVGHNARFLVELLGEQVDTEVTVLAGLGGGRDADDLARTVLEDHEIADADVVAGDGEGSLLAGVCAGDILLAVRVAVRAVGTAATRVITIDRRGDLESLVRGGVAGSTTVGGVRVLVVLAHAGSGRNGSGSEVGGLCGVTVAASANGDRNRNVVGFLDDGSLGNDGFVVVRVAAVGRGAGEGTLVTETRNVRGYRMDEGLCATASVVVTIVRAGRAGRRR